MCASAHHAGGPVQPYHGQDMLHPGGTRLRDCRSGEVLLARSLDSAREWVRQGGAITAVAKELRSCTNCVAPNTTINP